MNLRRCKHVYEMRPRKDKRGVDLISGVLPFGRLWHGEPDAVNNAIDYAKFRSRSHLGRNWLSGLRLWILSVWILPTISVLWHLLWTIVLLVRRASLLLPPPPSSLLPPLVLS